MNLPQCQHQGCDNYSLTGFWCQSCIEEEWPRAAIGDGIHWLVWKGATLVPPGVYVGAAGCPYILREPILPGSHLPFESAKSRQMLTYLMEIGVTKDFVNPVPCNWLLSPIEAIQNNVGTHIIACIINARFASLRRSQILDSVSPVLPIAAFPRASMEAAVIVRFNSRPLGELRDEVDLAESIFTERAMRQVGSYRRVMPSLKTFERARRQEIGVRYMDLPGRLIEESLPKKAVKQLGRGTLAVDQWVNQQVARNNIRECKYHRPILPPPATAHDLRDNILKGFSPAQEN